MEYSNHGQTLYHAGLNDLGFPEITVDGYLILTGCTGGNEGVDAISSGTFGPQDAVEVELVVFDGELLITRVVGLLGFLTVILFGYQEVNGIKFHFAHTNHHLQSRVRMRLSLFREATWDHDLHLCCLYHPFALFLVFLC